MILGPLKNSNCISKESFKYSPSKLNQIVVQKRRFIILHYIFFIFFTIGLKSMRTKHVILIILK